LLQAAAAVAPVALPGDVLYSGAVPNAAGTMAVGLMKSFVQRIFAPITFEPLLSRPTMLL
jgi:hypothetical protein